MNELSIRRTPSAYDPPLLIGQILEQAVRNTPSQEIVYSDRLRYTYTTLAERVARLASALAKLGDRPDQIVGPGPPALHDPLFRLLGPALVDPLAEQVDDGVDTVEGIRGRPFEGRIPAVPDDGRVGAPRSLRVAAPTASPPRGRSRRSSRRGRSLPPRRSGSWRTCAARTGATATRRATRSLRSGSPRRFSRRWPGKRFH